VKLALGCLRLSYPYAELVDLLFPRSRSPTPNPGDDSLAPALVNGTADEVVEPKEPRAVAAPVEDPPPTRDAKRRETFFVSVATVETGSEGGLDKEMGSSSSLSRESEMPPVREPPS